MIPRLAHPAWLRSWSLLFLALCCSLPSAWGACVSPRLFIGVDTAGGNDGSCAIIDLGGSLTSLHDFVPCQTIGQAIALVQAEQSSQIWIHVIGGSYPEGGLQLTGIPGGGGVHLGSNLPSCMTNSQLDSLGDGTWRARTQAGLSTGIGLVQINCAGFAHCISFAHIPVELHAIQFINAQQHAVQASDTQQDDQADAAAGGSGRPSRVSIANSAFIGVGGVLAADGCNVQITGSVCTQAQIAPNSPVEALVQLTQSALVLTDSSFLDNELPLSPTLLRSCVSLNSVGPVQREVVIDRCVWRNNFASSSYSDPRRTIFELSTPLPLRIPGGVAVRLVTDNLHANISNSEFTNCSISCASCMGGAVAVSTLAGAPGYRVDFAIHSSSFTQCANNGQGGVGGAVSVAEADSVWSPRASSAALILADTMAEVLLSNSVFEWCSAGFGGGAVHIGSVKSFRFTTSDLRGCACLADSGGALRIKQDFAHTFNAQPVSFFLLQLTFSGNTAGASGGSIHLEQLTSNLVIESASFENSTATRGVGGGINAYYCIQISMLQCTFKHTQAITGGGAAISRSRFALLDQCTFAQLSAAQAGGAVWMDSTPSTIQGSSFEDSFLSSVAAATDSSLVVQRMGGAIYSSGSDLSVASSSFTRSSALPNGLSPSLSPVLTSCASSYNAPSALCSVGVGGVIAALSSTLQLDSVTIVDAQACSGAAIYALSSNLIRMTSCNARGLKSYSGGLVAASLTQAVSLNQVTVRSSAAVKAGGVVVSANTPQMTMQQCVLDDSQCSEGDGGVIWYTHNRPALLNISRNTFTGYRAPLGAGGVLFQMIQLPDEFVLPASAWIDRSEWANQFDRVGPSNPDLVKYGTVQATSVRTLTSSLPSLALYPGLAYGPNSTQVTLSLLASDAYGQAVTADRQLVVGVFDEQLASSPGALSLNGVTLKQVNATTGAAQFEFTELSIGGLAGGYSVRFALTAQPTIRAPLPLAIAEGCPPSFFPSGLPLRSCIKCASALFVFNPAVNTCTLCPRGTQRIELTQDEANALRSAGLPLPGPLLDGVQCQPCPVGSLSEADGTACRVCAAASYRPTPGSDCVSCTGIAGLQCADGIPTISGGFFALSVEDENGQAQVKSYQCPDSFCSEAVIQSTAAANNSNAPVAAVTAYDQCAYPRLSSPTNLLCGECADGLQVWGNECTRCDGVNQGSVVLLLVLSLLLVLFMLRSAMRSSSASHLVVLSYFAQTVMLELGTVNPLLSWLNIALFSPNSLGSCVAPLSPYEQTQIAIVMPLVLLAELACVGLVHFVVSMLMCCRPPTTSGSPVPSSSLFAKLRVFNINFYISAALSMLLFFYSQVTIACMRYIYCVDVSGVSVVFSQPVMRCGSSEYRRTLILVIFGMVVYVAGFPLAIAIFLRRRAGLIRKISSYSTAQGGGRNSIIDFSEMNLSPPAVQFLQRYSPLFAMYSAHAWAWQLVVLARRATFVILAVALVQSAQLRFMAFSIAHVVSMCAQLYAEPFRVRFLNVAELSSVVLLMLHTMILTAAPPPYHQRAIDVLIFLMVVPPLALYPVIAICIKRSETRAERRRHKRELRDGADTAKTHTKRASHDDWTSTQGRRDSDSPVSGGAPTFTAVRDAAAAGEDTHIEMTSIGRRKDAHTGKSKRSPRAQSESNDTRATNPTASGGVRLRSVPQSEDPDDSTAAVAEVQIRLHPEPVASHPAVITEEEEGPEAGPASPSVQGRDRTHRDKRDRHSSGSKHNKSDTPSEAAPADQPAHSRRKRKEDRKELTVATDTENHATPEVRQPSLPVIHGPRETRPTETSAPDPVSAPASPPAVSSPSMVVAPASSPAPSVPVVSAPSPKSLPPSTPLHLRRGVPVRPSPASTPTAGAAPAAAGSRFVFQMGSQQAHGHTRAPSLPPAGAGAQRVQLRFGVPVRPNPGNNGINQQQPQPQPHYSHPPRS